ncbi:hypothetical protein TRIP_C21052 [Candidatus Zixiibacteriota bacterium]|nr:hypothetical protein TRIP_C21052 [candidate division Zixibacteria bacterium]
MAIALRANIVHNFLVIFASLIMLNGTGVATLIDYTSVLCRAQDKEG